MARDKRWRIVRTREADVVDAEWVDSDGDGLSDTNEAYFGTNPNDRDSDDDGLTDGQEVETTYEIEEPYLLFQPSQRTLTAREKTNPLDADTDDDGINDGDEVNRYQTDPDNWDTDGDGLGDGDEVGRGTGVLDTDSDDDGLTDGDEVLVYGSDARHLDTDRDGLMDGQEVRAYGSDPTSVDSDRDGLRDGDEILHHGTNPILKDSDGDGWTDREETLGMSQSEVAAAITPVRGFSSGGGSFRAAAIDAGLLPTIAPPGPGPVVTPPPTDDPVAPAPADEMPPEAEPPGEEIPDAEIPDAAGMPIPEGELGADDVAAAEAMGDLLDAEQIADPFGDDDPPPEGDAIEVEGVVTPPIINPVVGGAPPMGANETAPVRGFSGLGLETTARDVGISIEDNGLWPKLEPLTVPPAPPAADAPAPVDEAPPADEMPPPDDMPPEDLPPIELPPDDQGLLPVDDLEPAPEPDPGLDEL